MLAKRACQLNMIHPTTELELTNSKSNWNKELSWQSSNTALWNNSHSILYKEDALAWPGSSYSLGRPTYIYQAHLYQRADLLLKYGQHHRKSQHLPKINFSKWFEHMYNGRARHFRSEMEKRRQFNTSKLAWLRLISKSRWIDQSRY